MKLRPRPEAGFTMLELLVVLVILPLILGGIAEALLASYNSESSGSSRVSGAVNTTLSSAFFTRDVRGASEITTLDNSSGSSFSANSPQVCSPGTGSFVLGLYHPVSASGPALDVAYWLTGSGFTTELDRYTCTLTSSWTSTNPAKVVVAIPPPGGYTSETTGSIQVQTPADLSPAVFQTAASDGWTPVESYAYVSTPVVAPASGATAISVGSTVGFTVGTNSSGLECSPSTTTTSFTGCSGKQITVLTTLGTVSTTCTGLTLTSFTGCGSYAGPGVSGAIATSALVTQYNVQSVQLSVVQPDGSYKYSVVASPVMGLPYSSRKSGPTLLTLGTNGIQPINGGGGVICPNSTTPANICVEQGGLLVDNGGTISCNGGGVHNYIYTYGPGGIYTVEPPGNTSCNSVGAIKADPIPDPLAPLPCLLNSTVASLPTDPARVGGVAFPGVYKTTQPSGVLQPGLYVVEDGVGTITGMAPYPSSYYNGDSSAGVLFYVPGPGPFPTGCFSATPVKGMQGAQVAGLVPFDAAQSQATFPGLNGNAGSSSLAGVWVWQDATDPSNASNPAQDPLVFSVTGSTQSGLAYLPSGQVYYNGSRTLTTGSMIASGITMSGSDQIVLTGQ